MGTPYTSGTSDSGYLIGDPFPNGAPAVPTMVNGHQVSAALEIQSTKGGLMLPRMSTAQIAALPTPGTGQIIFNSDVSSVVTLVNGVVGSALPRRFSQTWVGANAIRAAFTTGTFLIADGLGQPYQPIPFAGMVYLRGTAFGAIPNDLNVAVCSDSATPLNYLTLECNSLFLGVNTQNPPQAINAVHMTDKGLTEGGLVNPVTAAHSYLVLILGGTVGGLTGGDDTTTLTIDIFYM